MTNVGSEIEREIVHRLGYQLARIPNLKLVDLRRNLRIAGHEVDIDAVVEIGERQYEMLVAIKMGASPGIIRQAIRQLKSIRETLPESAELYLVVAGAYISPQGMEICKEEQVGCLDGAGNCYLAFGGVLIEINGNKNLSPVKSTSKSLFSPKSSRVLRVLLADVKKWRQVQEIAEEANISIGLVSRLKQKLLEEEFVVQENRRLRVKSPQRLLSAWSESYKYKRNEVAEYYSLDDASAVEERLAAYCSERSIRYALGLFSAASRIAPYVRTSKAFVYVEANLEETAEALQIKRVSTGANVMLLRPYDPGVFFKSREIDGINVVSDVQAYLDLKSYKGRGEEAANFLLQHSLEPSW
jgi:hypothetical protein